jgi:hypothetical protein
MKHAEYSLYKKHCGKRTIWYVRFWDYDLERFNRPKFEFSQEKAG